MADSRSIIIDTTTQNGIKKQKSFTDVDPEATAVEMLNFANAAVQLTTDTFTGASVVDKESLTTDKIPVTLTTSQSTTINFDSYTDGSQIVNIIPAINGTRCRYNASYPIFPLIVENTSGIIPIIKYTWQSGSGSTDMSVKVTGTKNADNYSVLIPGFPPVKPTDASWTGKITIKTQPAKGYEQATLTITVNKGV